MGNQSGRIVDSPGLRIVEKLRMSEALMWLWENIAAVFLILFPKKTIVRWIRRRIADRVFLCRPDQIHLYKSGRAALCALLSGIRNSEPERRIVFVPDYTCNVVVKACEAAGFDVKAYGTDQHGYPDWQSLEESLHSDEFALVIFCSMFGSMPVLDWRLSEMLQKHPEVMVIADECQNMMNWSPVGGVRIPNGGIVFSFNDKTCPGALGGGYVIPDGLSASPVFEEGSARSRAICSMGVAVMSIRKSLRELMHILKLAAGFALTHRVSPSPEFSYCRRAHYNLLPEKIYRQSAARALVSLLSMERYERIRMENASALSDFVTDRSGSCSGEVHRPSIPPYLLLRTEIIEVIRRSGSPFPVKAPYACPENSETSCRPLFAVKVNVPYVRYTRMST